MGVIKFSAKFSGGIGNISIHLKSKSKSYDVELNVGNPNMNIPDAPKEYFVGVISGNAPNSTAGSIVLDINGDINPTFNHAFKAGYIKPFPIGFDVTDNFERI
ncbi:MAG: hypothetical protein ACXVDZ_17020 [Bacteroidia bacterium]